MTTEDFIRGYLRLFPEENFNKVNTNQAFESAIQSFYYDWNQRISYVIIENRWVHRRSLDYNELYNSELLNCSWRQSSFFLASICYSNLTFDDKKNSVEMKTGDCAFSNKRMGWSASRRFKFSVAILALLLFKSHRFTRIKYDFPTLLSDSLSNSHFLFSFYCSFLPREILLL